METISNKINVLELISNQQDRENTKGQSISFLITKAGGFAQAVLLITEYFCDPL